MKVITGITPTAHKTMIYGLSGVGKSTLASKLKNPLFLDFEGGVNYIDVPRTPPILYDEQFYQYLTELFRAKEREYDTLVIDSADWMMRKFHERAAGTVIVDPKTNKVQRNLHATIGKAEGGYGNGYQYLNNLVRSELIPRFINLNKEGYAICLIAHAERKNMMDGDGVNTDIITPAIDERIMHVFTEGVDNVFYLKQNGDERTLVLDGNNANVLAKNRLGLKGEIVLDEDFDINELLMPKTAEKENK